MTESVAPRPSRNEPCHCGSGKKYKQCCLDKDDAADRQARADSAPPVAPAEAAEATTSEAETHRAPTPPKHATRQPWKQRTDTRGFQKVNVPRRSGGS